MIPGFASTLEILAALAGCVTPELAATAYRPDRGAIRTVLAEASRSGLRGAIVWTRRSVGLTRGGRRLVTIVTGRGTATRSDGNEGSTCFVAFTPAGGKPQLLLTMGQGEWEATSCNGVAAIGVVRATGQPLRIALIHDGSSPNYGDREPIILSVDPCLRSARLDLDAYRKASRAGAQSIAQVRAALR